jgi:hypothetical protein
MEGGKEVGKIYSCEGESVNRSQMDIKLKTCDIRTCKKNIYFSANPPSVLILIHFSCRFTIASKPAA